MNLPVDEVNPYLQQEVFTASPQRLRLMLIQRAEELCSLVGQLWQDEDDAQAAGWLLRIREILGELLEGVKDKTNPASRAVSDLYVFLLQYLTAIETERDQSKLVRLQAVLRVESETWQQVVTHSLASSQDATRSRWDTPNQPPMDHPPLTTAAWQATLQLDETSGGFSLEV